MKLSPYRWVTLVILWTGILLLNIFHLWEAYGFGPPFYQQTANLDKWNNPFPFLIFMDLGALLVSAILIGPVWRKRNIH